MGRLFLRGKIKKKKLLNGKTAVPLVALSCIGLYSGANVAMHAVAATVTLPIIARLLRAIEVTVASTMDFGTIAMYNKASGRVTLDPEGVGLRIDGKSGLTSVGGVPRAGKIRIRGLENPVEVSVEDSIVKLTNGKDSVSVTGINFLTANRGSEVTIIPHGDDFSTVIPVGASLKTKVNQLAGDYTGSTRISINYQ